MAKRVEAQDMHGEFAPDQGCSPVAAPAPAPGSREARMAKRQARLARKAAAEAAAAAEARAAAAIQRAEDERFMQQALDQARLAAAAGEVPIGAVVVCQGQVIAAARNERETRQDPSAHAEFTALCQAARELDRWRLPDCTVYVTLEPCVMCAGLMSQSRVGRCVYGAPDPKGGALGTLYQVNADARLNHRFPVTAGVLQEECAEELRRFFAAKRSGRAAFDSDPQEKEDCPCRK